MEIASTPFQLFKFYRFAARILRARTSFGCQIRDDRSKSGAQSLQHRKRHPVCSQRRQHQVRHGGRVPAPSRVHQTEKG